MSISGKVDFFLDFQQFGDLKMMARNRPEDASTAVAAQFEGLFLQQMLSAMRSASQIDSQQQSSYVDFYQEMYDKQLAQVMAKQGSLGVARMILQQIPGSASNQLAPVEDLVFENRHVIDGTTATAAAGVTESMVPGLPGLDAGVVVNKVLDDDFAEVTTNQQLNARWQNPHNFIADIWPHARKAANTLGVSPALLVAQSALETGWGKHTIKFEDGRSSHNLFGIKAGSQWGGSVLTRPSLEYSDGVLSSEVARFRAYGSASESLADYVHFIQSNPRYRNAIDLAGNDRAYIAEIQRAGYATDPQYADKVMEILNSEMLQRSLASQGSGDLHHV